MAKIEGLNAAITSQAEEREEKSKSKVWLPEGKITLEPFINPAEKRQWMSPPSQSSNGTSQRDSDAGPSIGADGSNHAASKDSNESGRERQSLAVSTAVPKLKPIPLQHSSNSCLLNPENKVTPSSIPLLSNLTNRTGNQLFSEPDIGR